MRQVLDTVWQRRGTSWLWDEEARNTVCAAGEVWSLRQFLRAVGNWPESLPSNADRTLVVAGLEGSLDLLAPDQSEIWLGDTIKPAILSFQDEWGSDGALIFWLPKVDSLQGGFAQAIHYERHQKRQSNASLAWRFADAKPPYSLLADSFLLTPRGIQRLRSSTTKWNSGTVPEGSW